jgi:hypothetical protein
VGVRVRYRNKRAIVAAGGKIVAATKKSTSKSIKCKGVVDRFFYWKGVVHHEFGPCGRTVNGQFYLEGGHEAFEGGSAKEELFFVPKVQIHPERSPISDDRRNFGTGPTRYPAKRAPGRVPEMEETLRAVYIQWRGVL